MDINILNFPLVFREKLTNNEVILPEHIETEYLPKKAYRSVLKKADGVRCLVREDLMSYAELGKKPPRNLVGGKSNPDYYSTSFFTSLDMLKNKFSFPNPKQEAIVGYVYQEGGPCLHNKETTHLSWWMYENADISDFSFVEENNE